MTYAPIVVFAFNRPVHFKTVMTALANNPEASNSEVYIFCDGPRSDEDARAVAAVRAVACAAEGFSKVQIVERAINFGLARSIIEGVEEVCALHGRAIVLEDDVVPSPYFISYANDALDKYADSPRVLSIGCYSFDVGIDLPETFFLNVPDCWGWAVWQRSWREFQPDGSVLLEKLRARGLTHKFDFESSYPYTQMLEDQIAGRVQSWAIRWYAHSLLTDRLVLYPRRAVTRNIGFDGTGSQCGASRSWEVCMTDRRVAVRDIPLREDLTARAAWRSALRNGRQ
jgi:hypothetical protein